MVESLVLIEGRGVNRDSLASVSLMNAKQVVLGGVPSMGIVLHLAANSSSDLSKALLEFAEISGVSGVLTLMVRNS